MFQNLAVDVGSGFTKVVHDDVSISFPSAAAVLPENDTFCGVKPEVVTVKDVEWLIGESAINTVAPDQRSNTLSDQWAGSPGWMALMYAAIAKTKIKGNINLITGIPQALFADKDTKSMIIDQLKGQHTIHWMDGEAIEINIEKVIVIPQASGAVLAVAAYDDSVLSDTVGVIDIGTYTTGFSVMRDGQFVNTRSGGVCVGVSDLLRALQDFIEKEYAQKVDIAELPRMLRNRKFRHRGESIDLTRHIYMLAERVSPPIINAIKEIWQGGNDLRVFVAGGGAPYFLSAIKGDIFHAEAVDDNFFAIAKGMLVYLDSITE